MRKMKQLFLLPSFIFLGNSLFAQSIDEDEVRPGVAAEITGCQRERTATDGVA